MLFELVYFKNILQFEHNWLLTSHLSRLNDVFGIEHKTKIIKVIGSLTLVRLCIQGAKKQMIKYYKSQISSMFKLV